MSLQKLLEETNVNIHVVATGAGAELLHLLCEEPGSSAFLSGFSFPYAQAEQDLLLGFKPDQYCSEETAIDLASAAYMKAYQFKGKKSIGLGLTAVIASEEEHQGDHRVFACGITDDQVISASITLPKNKGAQARTIDNETCNKLGIATILKCANSLTQEYSSLSPEFKDATILAKERFMLRPFFDAAGNRFDKLPKERFALMPGNFYPPHEGHFGAAKAAQETYKYNTVFEITTDPPHRSAPSVQQMLQKAKLLQGHSRFFSSGMPLYLDKARKFKKTPIIMGADAYLRMIDPKWCHNFMELFGAFFDYNTTLLVAGREIDDNFVSRDDLIKDIKSTRSFKEWANAQIVTQPLEGEWNVSSTQLRK